MYAAYKDSEDVAFYLVYVREAHPVAQPKLKAGEKPTTPSQITQPKTLDERVLAASACMKGLHLTLPVLIDTMDGAAGTAYRGVPAATVVIDREGTVVFHASGPNGSR